MLKPKQDSEACGGPGKGRRAGAASGRGGAAWAVLLGLLLALATAGGCTSAKVRSQPWQGGPEAGRTIVTEHYALHTTIEEEGFLAELSRTMEEAHGLYSKLAPLSRPQRQLHAYVYAYRDEWAEYTESTAGSLAPVYLQIHRGGYAHAAIVATSYHAPTQPLASAPRPRW